MRRQSELWSAVRLSSTHFNTGRGAGRKKKGGWVEDRAGNERVRQEQSEKNVQSLSFCCNIVVSGLIVSELCSQT